MGKLDEKIAIITGAARRTGIGFNIAKKFGQEGAKVIIVDMLDMIYERENELKNLGITAKGYVVDLTKAHEIESMVKDIITTYKRIDILCNNAGKSIPPRPPFTEMSEEYFDTVIARNLKTTFLCSKAVVPFMILQKYGKIVNISSITGNRVVYRYCAAYASSKGAVTALTKSLALELGVYNISVNAISPGQIDVDEDRWTPENDKYGFNNTPELLRWAFHRPGFPEEIASLACFLSSDECTWLTGEDIVIDGGSTILEPPISPNEISSSPPKKANT